MKATDMQPGVRYMVTRGSVCGEFLSGDVIELMPDGALLNRTAGGWIDAQEIADASDGMECQVDVLWTARRRETLAAELAALGGA